MTGRTLTELAPLVGIMARERTIGNDSAYDDAYQEGMIAAWRAQQAHPDATGLLTVAARRGISHSVSGRAAFGAVSHQGRRDALKDASAIPEGLDVQAASYDTALTVDVLRAVSTLAPADREIAFRRFWLGEPWAVIGDAVGRSMGSVFGHWSRNIKPQLRAAA